MADAGERPLRWVGPSRRELKEFPVEVQKVMGYALFLAQIGVKHPDAKPLKGHRGAGVLEVADDFKTDTYRAVYTIRFHEAVYVLHAFQKKSTRGIQTPKHILDVVSDRLEQARRLHQEEFGSRRSKEENR